MEYELRWLADGSLSIRVPDQAGLSFEQASAGIKALAAELRADGFSVALASEPERHTHGPQHEHVRAQS